MDEDNERKVIERRGPGSSFRRRGGRPTFGNSKDLDQALKKGLGRRVHDGPRTRKMRSGDRAKRNRRGARTGDSSCRRTALRCATRQILAPAQTSIAKSDVTRRIPGLLGRCDVHVHLVRERGPRKGRTATARVRLDPRTYLTSMARSILALVPTRTRQLRA